MSAFSSPSFRWLLGSTMAAYLGIGMQLTAIAWLAVALSFLSGISTIFEIRERRNIGGNIVIHARRKR